jgi:PAS domain S-box-containing protein
MTITASASGTRGLILAPQGRDAAVALGLLSQAGIAAEVCADFETLQARIDDETLFVVATNEAMLAGQVMALASLLREQPAWSDLPFVLLIRGADRSEPSSSGAELFALLGNVTFLERPFHPTTFISMARSAMKGRLRQFEARSRIEELDESDRRLRTALQAGRLGSWELDLSTETLTADKTFKGLFGREPDESLSFGELVASVHPDDRARLQSAIQGTVDTGEDYAIEHRVIRPDGSLHWADIRARLVRESDSRTRRLVGVSSDVTARKASEEAMRQLNETLEARVRARTDDLERAHAAVLSEIEQRERAERKLLQAQKVEMIGQLTGGVAHDFNNLLMAVLANLELLRKHLPSDARTLRLIDGALQGVQRGTALTQRLLAFARQQDLQLEPRDLADLIRGMSELVERAVGAGIEVRMDLPPLVPAALIEANQIELAVLNLVVNGRDAMPDGGVLTISVDQVEGTITDLPPGQYVRLSVIDTGNGMSEETLRKATDPFFSTKELGKGTGLGLSMVHGLALQLGGVLRLSSEEARGTRAELWLPTTTAIAQERGEITGQSVEDIPAMTILVVDDDALISMSTVDMLEDLGHEVLEAHSGKRALEILREDDRVDLMITDYAMPTMNGMELATTARELRPDLPILLATGYAELPSGPAIDLPRIDKPYHQERLAAGIAMALQPRRRSSP